MKLAINHHATRINENSNYIFGREDFAENLKNIFANTDGGFVLAIDASWGEGKTSFIHQLIYDLKYSSNLIPIYYDAFSNDFSSDTFLSIGATISSEVENHFLHKGLNTKNKTQIEHLKNVTKKTAVELIKLGTNLAVRSLTAGIVDSSELEKFAGNAFNSATFGTLEIDLNKKFEAYENSKNSIQSYVKALESVCSESEKVIFFIDELDRCRPNFAVEVLEKIKHLFIAKNVIFVISYNKSQLSKIISSVYGVDAEDSVKYLEKFIHIEAKLPTIDSNSQKSSYKLLFNSFIDEFNIQLPSNEYLRDMFVSLCSDQHLKMNSREIERAFSYVSFCFASLPQDGGLELFRFFLPAAMIKVKNRDQFESIKSGNFNSSNGDNSQKWMYDFFKKYYSEYLEQKASNVYYVKGFEEACTIVSIFKLPADVE